MQNKYHASQAGQEVTRDDLNAVALEAAIAEDRALHSLFQPHRFDGSSAAYKAVLAYGPEISTGYPSTEAPVVKSTGLANASVTISPLRILLGKTYSTTDDIDETRSIRMEPAQSIQLTATGANDRIDLIYVAVSREVPASNVTRTVRAANGTNTPTSLSIFDVMAATVGFVAGSESATPAIPSLPADTGTTFYVPLALVYHKHPHTLTTSILNTQIREIAPLMRVPPVAGGNDVRPAAIHNRIDAGNDGWTSDAGRPDTYLPPTAQGKVERVIVANFSGSTTDWDLDATTVLDDTVDWRKRLFKSSVLLHSKVGGGLGGADGDGAQAWAAAALAGTAQAFPYGIRYTDGGESGPYTYSFFGQSFVADRIDADGNLGSPVAGEQGVVLQLDDTHHEPMAASSSLRVFVDEATGNLCAAVSATSPGCMVMMWIEALSPFVNI